MSGRPLAGFVLGWMQGWRRMVDAPQEPTATKAPLRGFWLFVHQLWRAFGGRGGAEAAVLVEPPPEDDGASAAQGARRMMEVVAVLHERGYGGIRLGAGLSPSGVHWRGRLYAAKRPQVGTETHSTGAGPRVLFGWTDMRAAPMPALADRVLAEFPELAAAGRHQDPDYVSWYAEMLARTAPSGLIYFAADFPLPESGVGVCNCDAVRVPPPPGRPG